MAKKKPAVKPRGRGRPATGVTPQRQLRVSTEEWSAAVKRAEAAGVSVSEWVRTAIREAVQRELDSLAPRRSGG